MKAMAWTAEEDERLKSLMRDGLTFSAAAEAMGKTKNAVISRARKIGAKSLHPSGGYWLEARKANNFDGKRRIATVAPKPVLCQVLQLFPDHDRTVNALLVLEPLHCRWPVGDDNFTFCGADKAAGSSYCQHHHGIAYGGRRATKEERMAIEKRVRKHLLYGGRP